MEKVGSTVLKWFYLSDRKVFTKHTTHILPNLKAEEELNLSFRIHGISEDDYSNLFWIQDIKNHL